VSSLRGGAVEPRITSEGGRDSCVGVVVGCSIIVTAISAASRPNS
jgi:hypothetical protein